VALVLPLLPEPELAPLAASTVPTLLLMLLLPFWPVAVALPVSLVAVPVLLTVLLLVCVPLALLLPPSLAAPVVVEPLPPLLIEVEEFRPVPLALPLLAVAELLTLLVADWTFVALVLPAPPEPELAPPAASTVPVWAVVLLLPTWPVAVALPLVLDELPVLLTFVVLVVVLVEPLLPPLVAPPVVVLPLLLVLTVVVVLAPVELTLPLVAEPDVDEVLLAVFEFVAVVLPAANAWPVTIRVMTAADAPARNGKAVFDRFFAVS
jgi:hypothetical protein